MPSDLYELVQQQLDTNGGFPLVLTGYVSPTINLVGTTPATAANYGRFYTFPFSAGYIESITYSYSGEGGAAAAFQVEKLTSGQAKDAGTDLLSTAADTATAGNVNKPLSASLVSGAAIQLTRGDALGLVNSGTLTSLDDLSVTVRIKVTQF